jgi:hypothetical protein
MVELGKARLMEALKKTRSTRRARVGLVLWSRRPPPAPQASAGAGRKPTDRRTRDEEEESVESDDLDDGPRQLGGGS